MRAILLLLSLGLPAAPAGDEAADTAADLIELRDGSVVRGQVLGPDAAGGVMVLIRRDWARKNVGRWLTLWEREEAPRVQRARQERKLRIYEWKKQRRDDVPNGDPILRWITRETAALSTVAPPNTPLMAAAIARQDVRNVIQQSDDLAKLLRIGWLANVGAVEDMTIEELRSALRFRGRLRRDDPAYVDGLLPLYPESDDRWRMRRAVTETAVEPQLRLVQFRQFTLPELNPNGRSDQPPQTITELLDSPEARTAFESIQAVRPSDPLQDQLASAADRGRVGLIFSTLTFSIDAADAVAVSTLWVRQQDGRWTAMDAQRAQLRVDAPAVANEPLLDMTPIKTALLVLESVSAQPKSPAESRVRQALGTVGQRVLGRARVALNAEIESYLLPIVPPRR